MKKIIKSICFSLLAFMFAIGSIFLPIGTQNKYASADSTNTGLKTFTSSNILVSRLANTETSFNAQGNIDFDSFISSNANQPSITIDNILLSWSFVLQQDSTDTSRCNMIIQAIYDSSIFVSYGEPYQGRFYNLGSISASSMTPTTGIYGVAKTQFNAYSGGYKYAPVGFSVHSPDFSGNSDVENGVVVYPSYDMVSVEISNGLDFSAVTGVPSTYFGDYFAIDVNSPQVEYDFTNSNVVSYVDTLGFRFTFWIPSQIDLSDGYSYTDGNFYQYRKYFLTPNYLTSNNQYYQQGLEEGKSQGFNTGYSSGYSAGTSVGYENGFENGKIEGALTANNYSFFGLISAVIDAPVKILTSLFNFNFLGVNLWAFFTSILTISLIIFVIRKFMAKG